MKVSKKAYYGFRALAALAQTKSGRSSRDLAEAENLPENYLHKVLQCLKSSGFVESRKGMGGGYRLARSAESIASWDVIEALDGGFKTPDRAILSGAIAPCPIVTHCQTKSIWKEIEQAIEEKLSGITLADLIPRSPNIKEVSAENLRSNCKRAN